MQTGPYIAERLLPKFVEACCRRARIEYQAFSDEWVLRLAKDETTRWIVGSNFDLNRSAAGEVARDKVATYTALSAAGIPAIPHYLVRALPRELVHVRELHEQLGDRPVVAKPLQGTAGRGVARFELPGDALDMIRRSGEPAWALSPHADLQAEYRLIMLDGKVLLAYEKMEPVVRGGLKMFNLSLGAVPADIADAGLLQQLEDMAVEVMRALALRLAAVDVVRLPAGTLTVLEVNGGIYMEHYARYSAENKERAAYVYEAIVAAMFS